MVNWKKASAILVTIGVTATVLYVSYSVVFLANKKDLALIKTAEPNNRLFQKLVEGEAEKMEKKISNITKKQLKRLHELSLKEEFTAEELKDYDSIIKKWDYKNK
jgi:hypothetical protein